MNLSTTSQSTKHPMISANKAEQVIAPEKLGACIQYGAPLYNEIMHFLTIESRCLDDDRLMDWVDLLADDIIYSVPVRQTVHRNDSRGFSDEGFWIYDAKAEIVFKMKRVAEGDSGWAEDPASRSRRFFSSVLVYETDQEGEYLVQSNILVKRGRGNKRELETLSARRDDIIRRKGDRWEISRRLVLLDHTVLGMQNFAIFV